MTTYSQDDLRQFTAKGAVATTASGTWYEIETKEEAMLMQAISMTAVGIFYGHAEEGRLAAAEGTRWLVLLDEEAEAPVLALLAAQPETGREAEKWPFDSHITGYRNQDVGDDLQIEIAAFAADQGLHVKANHMGTLLIDDPDSPGDDEGMEP